MQYCIAQYIPLQDAAVKQGVAESCLDVSVIGQEGEGVAAEQTTAVTGLLCICTAGQQTDQLLCFVWSVWKQGRRETGQISCVLQECINTIHYELIYMHTF